VSPGSYYLQLHSGDCGAPPSLVVDSNSGSLSTVVPLGRYHVMVGNPTDEAGAYEIHVDYPLS